MTSKQKRAILYYIFDRTASLTITATTYTTLLAALQALTTATTGVTAGSSSGIITSVSANGHNVQFADPQTQAVTTLDDFSANSSEMRDLYTDSRLILISSGIAIPTDSQIWDEMMYRLTPCTEVGPSCFNTLRCA